MGIKRSIIFRLLHIAKFLRSLLFEGESTYKILLIPGYEKYRWHIGKLKAWYVFEQAKKKVPAYKKFLEEHEFKGVKINSWDPKLDTIPITDKESYIKKYSIEERCIDGVIPKTGVMIDESSGTSGSPNNWVRGTEERIAVKKALQFSLRHALGDSQIFILNAFALGPWATGMNVSMSFVDVSILKSIGPDIKKIENTLSTFGPKYQYVIMGYPPFLKSLVDSARLDWEKYNITAIYGGEGMTEAMRKYLYKAFSKVYGSYGASDLEINIAAENDFTIALRKKITENKLLRERLIRVESTVLPMIFQYNPLDYYIETNAQGELIVTLCRDGNISPKIRYNIHDTGHVIRLPELKKILQECDINIAEFGDIPSDLPFLFHYGRSDMAVAFFGCKITPPDIEGVLYSIPHLVHMLSSFSIITYEDEKVDKKLILAIELAQGSEIPTENGWIQSLQIDIFEKLKGVNQDYKEIVHMIPPGQEPKIELYPFGKGPFEINDIRLKKHYIQKY